MEDTTQVNLRLPKQLLEKIEFITDSLKVNRNDWIKVKLAEMINNGLEWEMFRMVEYAEDKYIRGVIDDKEFKKRKGFEPTKEMNKKREEYKEKSERLNGHNTDFAKRYLEDAKKEVMKK